MHDSKLNQIIVVSQIGKYCCNTQTRTFIYIYKTRKDRRKDEHQGLGLNMFTKQTKKHQRLG